MPSLSLSIFVFYSGCSSDLVCCFMFFLLGSVSGIFSLPSSFCLGSFHPLSWWVSFPSSFCVFLLVRPSCLFVAFCLYCPLPFSPFLHEVLGRFLPSFEVSPFRVSPPLSFVSPYSVPLGFVLPLLALAFSFSLFFVSLVCPLVLLVSSLGFSLACSFLVPCSSSLFLSAWCSLYLRA